MAIDPQEYTYLWKDRIVSHPEILGGKPTIKGTRLSVEFVMDMMRGPGGTTEYMLGNYPHITREDLKACHEYAMTGAKLSNFTWADWDRLMADEDEKREQEWRDAGYPLWEENASSG